MERQWLADILNGRGDHRFILDCGGGIINISPPQDIFTSRRNFTG